MARVFCFSGLLATAAILSSVTLAQPTADTPSQCKFAEDIAKNYKGDCDFYQSCQFVLNGTYENFLANAGALFNTGFLSNEAFLSNEGFFANEGDLLMNSGFTANDGFTVENPMGISTDQAVHLLWEFANQGYLSNAAYADLGNAGFLANSGFVGGQSPVDIVNMLAFLEVYLVSQGVLLTACDWLNECDFFAPNGYFDRCVVEKVSECLEMYVGDGFCDPECNNVEFNFDGGDCNTA